MYRSVFENPLRNPFVGEWTVLTKIRGKGEDTTVPDIETVEIGLRMSGGDKYYNLQMYDGGGCEKDHWHLRADVSSDTIFRISDGSRICVSFWRYASYDIIFALKEDGGGGEFEIWSAKRDHARPSEISSGPPYVENLTGEKWRIALTTGAHGAKGCVRVRELGGVESEKNEGDSIATTGLFGLFHYDSVYAPLDEGQLYDILAYDEAVRSYNSVFGVRSLNYYWAEEPGECRVFATFSNKSSVPATHIPVLEASRGAWRKLGHKIGCLMPFESNNARSGSDIDKGKPRGVSDENPVVLAEDVDSNDPDAGAWAGEPG